MQEISAKYTIWCESVNQSSKVYLSAFYDILPGNEVRLFFRYKEPPQRHLE